mmetsp:Transcript_139198/g.277525  ORF Transcript_139198/g.277525 Transcript_139198/m.277525 type:complete len:94 (-) Transcript_139198:1999-2280(-)
MLNTYWRKCSMSSVPPASSSVLKLIQGRPDRAQDSSPVLDLDDAFAAASALEARAAMVEFVVIVVVDTTVDVTVVVVIVVPVVVVVVVGGYRL